MTEKSNRKKICLIITLGEQGGAQRYVRDLASNLPKDKFVTTVAVGNQGTPWLQEQCEKQGIRVQTLKHTVREIINPLRDIYAVFELYTFFKKERFDIVHTNSSKIGFTASIAARLARIPRIVYTAHGFVFAEPLSWWRKLLYLALEQLSAPLKDVIITVSHKDATLAKKHHIKPKNDLLTIHNGIKQPSFFPREEAQEKLNITHDIRCRELWVGCVANLYATKGLDHLVEASKLLTKKGITHQLYIIGEGPERDNLEQLITDYELENTVQLLGVIPDAARYLKAFDIFVLPSVKEGFPYTLLEAAAAQLPIVATRIGGIPEIAEKYNALTLVPPKDAQALADAIYNYLGVGHLSGRETKKENVPSFPFSLQEMISKTIEVYSDN